MKYLLCPINPFTLANAFRNSLAGLKLAIKAERAFQQEVVLLAVGSVAALILTDVVVERALMIGSLALVLIVELLNSAVESAIDRVSTEKHPLSKNAKDLGSAAVLISLVTAAAIWVIILI
jgi:diacylglycerol kinase (ATP)